VTFVEAAKKWLRRSGISLVAVCLASCHVGPDYVRPEIEVGTGFAQQEKGWVRVSPQEIPEHGQWWTVYQDPELDALMARLNENNLSIEQALARYRQAVALLRSTGARLYPGLDLSAQWQRADVPVTSRAGSVLGGFGPNSQHNVGLGLSWEVDLWGGIASDVERSKAQMQASAADLAAAKLSAQATLASSYFQLRGLDSQIDLLQQTVAAYQKSLDLTRNLMKAGIADASEVAVADSQLQTARAQWLEARRERAVMEHAIAVLTGSAPSLLQVPESHGWSRDAVAVPTGVPSTLLLRRPDIAAAERRVAAANAQVGVATAAWFPSLSISASGGYQSGQFSQWFTAPAQFWALGPTLAATLFDAGRRQAGIDSAKAQLEEQAAVYRNVVLKALQEVEDSLVQLKLLDEQVKVQEHAVRAAQESVRIKRNQYEKGLADYVSVAVLQAALLNAQRSLIALQTEQLMASVKLVAALGGGWSVDKLPDSSNSVGTTG